MTENIANNQIAGLVRSSKKKQQEALAKTKQAIDNLIQNKQKITIRAVAREAGVSTSYIYKYPELAYEIQSLRDRQKYDLDQQISLAVNTFKRGNLTKNIEELSIQQIQYLELYIEEIKRQPKSTSELKKENINLQLENKKLRQKLEFTRQQLAEIREFILSQGINYT